jgi:hypothetical protein
LVKSKGEEGIDIFAGVECEERWLIASVNHVDSLDINYTLRGREDSSSRRSL